MKKVLLFACIEKNIGDDLFINTVCDRYKEVQFYISKSADYGDLSKIKNLHFSKLIMKWNRYNEVASNNKIKNFIAHAIAKILRMFLPRFDCGVYIVGNAFKNNDYRGKIESKWIVERVKLVERFYLLSTNFGPYTDEKWKQDFDNIFPEMKDVCFRDKDSYELFKELDNVRYAPDTVLSIGEKKVDESNRRLVLISLIDCLYPARSEKIKNCAMSYEDKIVEATDYYVKKGYEVVLVNSNTEQDMPAIQRIYSKCKNVEKVKIFEYKGDYSEIFKLYEGASLVIGTRLHTIILAWLYGIPVFPIIYDIKVKNMLKSYGFNSKCVGIEDINMLDMEYVDCAIKEYDFTGIDILVNNAQKQFEVLDKELLEINKNEHK